MSTGRLNSHVHVRDERGRVHVFGPDDQVPEWAARKITSRAAWAQPPVFERPAPSAAPAAPDRPQASATKEVWSAYAIVRGIPLPPGATKQQIIDAIDAAESDPGEGGSGTEQQ